MKKTVLILIFSLFLFSGFSQDIKPAFDKLLKEFSENEAGGCILVQKGDEILYVNSVGVSDINTKEKITEHTIFNTGSISKTLVANGILILQERGLLSVEDNLAKYFPDFKNKEIAEKVKIKHLLSHTSGLPDNRNVSKNPTFYLTAKDTANFEPLKKAKKLNFDVGEQFEYSNPAYNGLALIIEKVAKQPWQDFIIENIFKPSGMTESRITNGAHPAKDVAHGYELKDGIYTEYDYGEYPTFTASGNGGVWCSVLDLAKYEKALKSHTFLSKKTINTSRTVLEFENWKSKAPPHVGYSWFVGEKSLFGNYSDIGEHIVYHTGSQGGFRAFYITVPEKDILYVALFNRPPKDLKAIMKSGLTILKQANWLE